MLSAKQQFSIHGTNLQLLGFNVEQQQFADSLNRGCH
jgi:hypothetical protein